MLPVFETTFSAAELMRLHPPRLANRNKQIVFGLTCPPDGQHSGTISFARYRSAPLPQSVSGTSRTVLEERGGIFTYEPERETRGTVAWHLNFANAHLFCAYGGRAFAQDELQVAEHPALGALREALLVFAPGQLLAVENGDPTPILIMGVERRCEINTAAHGASANPAGLYGRRFAAAGPDAVQKAVRLIQPPTRSNILAIEAPANGTGRYSRTEIEFILRTAYSGFCAARAESNRRAEVAGIAVAIHTGFWGCGAYGNDRVLMALLQFLAARMAKVDRLVFHTADKAGAAAYAKALSILEKDLFGSGLLRQVLHRAPKDQELSGLIARIDRIGFRWGESDGN